MDAKGTTFVPITPAELVAKYGRALVGIDGNAAFALLGDLPTGEAEFVTMDNPADLGERLASCKIALMRLRERLKLPNLSYYYDASHPYGRD